MEFRTIFGPVLSSRLGRSLGLDLLGKKICTHDCLYCEVGPTTTHTLRRAPYVPARTLLTELALWKEHADSSPDHITLGGSGEPCLNSDLPEIISGVKNLFPHTPVAVLTNSALIGHPDVRTALLQADVILPSMDTLDPQAFLRLNRPHKGIELSRMAQDLLDFRLRILRQALSGGSPVAGNKRYAARTRTHGRVLRLPAARPRGCRHVEQTGRAQRPPRIPCGNCPVARSARQARNTRKRSEAT